MYYKNKLSFLLALVLMVLSVPVQAARVKHVFIISMDGGKPSAIKNARMPVLKRLIAEGASSFKARTIYPSITLPSHTSMVSGVPPSVHKILWNRYEPQRGFVKVPTIFGLAKEAGLSTAIFAGKDKLKHLNVPGTVTKFYLSSVRASLLGKKAGEYIVSNKPSLMLVHFLDPDAAGHKYGWDSPEQLSALATVDGGIEQILEAIKKAKIEDSSAIIITADHGGSGRSHGSDSDADTQIPWIAWGEGILQTNLDSKSISTMDTAATALWLLGLKAPSNWQGQPVREAFRLQR